MYIYMYVVVLFACHRAITNQTSGAFLITLSLMGAMNNELHEHLHLET